MGTRRSRTQVCDSSLGPLESETQESQMQSNNQDGAGGKGPQTGVLSSQPAAGRA